MEGLNVEDWVAHEPSNEWETMMKKVAKFHHKHDFAGKNGHDMGYRIALTVEELGELSAAITKGKPLEECAEEMSDIMILLMGHSIAMEIDLKSAFEKKYARIMQRKALAGRLGVRVTEYKNE
jgi:NTP pyrophosphatase (non-canonical NTP hydrolase)